MQSLLPLPVAPMQKRLFREKPSRSQKNFFALVCCVGENQKVMPRHAKVFLQDIRNSIHRGSVSGQESIFYLASKCHQIVPGILIYFLRKEQPSVSLALPPVGWQSTVEQPAQMTTVCA